MPRKPGQGTPPIVPARSPLHGSPAPMEEHRHGNALTAQSAHALTGVSSHTQEELDVQKSRPMHANLAKAGREGKRRSIWAEKAACSSDSAATLAEQDASFVPPKLHKRLSSEPPKFSTEAYHEMPASIKNTNSLSTANTAVRVRLTSPTVLPLRSPKIATPLESEIGSPCRIADLRDSAAESLNSSSPDGNTDAVTVDRVLSWLPNARGYNDCLSGAWIRQVLLWCVYPRAYVRLMLCCM